MFRIKEIWWNFFHPAFWDNQSYYFNGITVFQLPIVNQDFAILCLENFGGRSKTHILLIKVNRVLKNSFFKNEKSFK